jgi:membrane protease YdiL (CAAX protease family)
MAVTLAVLLGAVGIVGGLVAGVILFSLVSSFVALSTDSMAGNLVVTLGTYAAIAAVGYLFLLRNRLPLSYVRGRVPTLGDAGWAAATIVALVGFSSLVVPVIDALGLPFTEHSITDSIAADPAVALLFVPLSVLLVGPAEEFLYRGIIQTRLGETFDVAPTVLIAAAIFAAVHFPAYLDPANVGGTLVTVAFVLFPLGALLGAVYEHTGNLLVPAAAHGVYNAVVFGFSYAEVVGLF